MVLNFDLADGRTNYEMHLNMRKNKLLNKALLYCTMKSYALIFIPYPSKPGNKTRTLMMMQTVQQDHRH